MELNPVQLNFEEIGEGIPVVFLHGFPFDHTIWGEMVPLLRDQARSYPICVVLEGLRLQTAFIVCGFWLKISCSF
jgi:hypothetical protein